VCERGRHDALHRARVAVADPFAESFNARVRDELLNLEEFSCLAEARVLTEDWRTAYNAEHLHSSLGYRSPAAFAAAWTPGEQAAA